MGTISKYCPFCTLALSSSNARPLAISTINYHPLHLKLLTYLPPVFTSHSHSVSPHIYVIGYNL